MKTSIKAFLGIWLLLALGISAFGAISASTVWEVRTTGTDTNGGGFVTGASGTDMSQFNNKNAAACTSCQSTTVNISTTDAVTAVSTTVTSATANFSAALVGNLIYLSGGTGPVTAAWYQVTAFTNSTTVTVDRNIIVSTGVTLNIGGALATPKQGLTNSAASNTVWVQTGTYTVSATQTFPSGVNDLPNAKANYMLGYNSSRGDVPTGGTRPTITTGTAALVLVTIAGANFRMENFILDAASTGNTGIQVTVTNSERGVSVTNVSILNFKTIGLIALVGTGANGGRYAQMEITGGNASCTGGISGSGGLGGTFSDIYIHANACSGINTNSQNSALSMYRVISANNTSATGHGMLLDALLLGASCDSCVIYGNAGDGVKVAGTYQDFIIKNSVIYGNTGTGLNFGFNQGPAALAINYNGVGGNGTNRTNVTAGANDVVLTVDPFTSGSGGNFALNATAGGGAALKSVGFPGVFPGAAATGFADIGTIRHQDPAGGGATVGVPIIQ